MLTAKFIWEVEVQESSGCTRSLVCRVDAPNGNAVEVEEVNKAFVRKNRRRDAFAPLVSPECSPAFIWGLFSAEQTYSYHNQRRLRRSRRTQCKEFETASWWNE